MDSKEETLEKKDSFLMRFFKWLFLVTDGFVSSITIISLLRSQYGGTEEQCGSFCLFVITLPVAIVLNFILVIYFIVKKIRKNRKSRQLALQPFDPYKIEEQE